MWRHFVWPGLKKTERREGDVALGGETTRRDSDSLLTEAENNRHFKMFGSNNNCVQITHVGPVHF